MDFPFFRFFESSGKLRFDCEIIGGFSICWMLEGSIFKCLFNIWYFSNFMVMCFLKSNYPLIETNVVNFPIFKLRIIDLWNIESEQRSAWHSLMSRDSIFSVQFIHLNLSQIFGSDHKQVQNLFKNSNYFLILLIWSRNKALNPI